ncbi:MAG: IS1595 family transposase, partial [Gemmatimonadetes bacterium]|nr:IS1595 family transposase [Gemmatimonadota bacterium]
MNERIRGSIRTTDASHAKMPYWCSDCRSYFSVRTGTLMERSKVPIRKWVYAIYLDVTSLKGVAAMKLHRDIGVSYKTAWFMQRRIGEAFAAEGAVAMSGPVEVDEAHFGGKR